MLVHGVDSIDRNRGGVSFSTRKGGIIPLVSPHDTFDVAFPGDNDAIIMLVDIKAIEVGKKAKVQYAKVGLSSDGSCGHLPMQA